MASVQQRGDKWQLRVVSKHLPRPYFDTFDTEADARTYGAQLEALLARGIVPADLATGPKRTENPALSKIITIYLEAGTPAPSDRPVLAQLSADVGTVRLLDVSPAWADAWVGRLKTVDHLAPSTIRKRVEALARVLDWHARRTGGAAQVNPLRSMPRGYASPTAAEARAMALAGQEVRCDVERDRRLDAAELQRLRAALAGVARPDRQRAWPVDAGLTLLFELILGTGLRLSEAYRLRVDQVDLVRWVLRVEGSKGHRGKIKPRTVPLVPELRPLLSEACRDRVGRVFDFWDGTPEDLKKCTTRLSKRFSNLLHYADVPDCTEHDLRHEATCRWVTLRDPAGRWVFSETEICKIMGWSDLKMMLRYASLRGEDLAARLG